MLWKTNGYSLLEAIQTNMHERCSANLASNGVKDAMDNPDILHREQNKTLIKAEFKKDIRNWLPLVNKKITEYEVVIDRYSSNGMSSTAEPYRLKKASYATLAGELMELLEKEEVLAKKIEYPMLSYEIGFNNGLNNYHKTI